MRNFFKAVLAAGAILASPLAHAQTYPTKTVTLVIPFTPGGGVDLFGRYLADALSKEWNQSVVVENRPGASSTIGMGNVARSKPDGYTIAFTSSSFAVSAVGNLPFDPIKDLQPIAMFAEGQMVVVTGSRIPLPTVADVVKEAKKQKLFYAANGINSPTFATEIFSQAADIKLERVDYKGGAEALIDMAGGRCDIFFAQLPTVLSAIEAKQVTPVAVLGPKRLKLLPDVQTVGEAGYPNAQFSVWWGVFGPAGLPKDIATKINADIAKVMSTPAATEFLEKSASAPSAMSPDQFSKYYQDEVAKLREIGKVRNLIPN